MYQCQTRSPGFDIILQLYEISTLEEAGQVKESMEPCCTFLCNFLPVCNHFKIRSFKNSQMSAHKPSLLIINFYAIYLATEHNTLCVIASELKTQAILLLSKMDCTLNYFTQWLSQLLTHPMASEETKSNTPGTKGSLSFLPSVQDFSSC